MFELSLGSSLSTVYGGDARLSLEKWAMSVGLISIRASDGGFSSRPSPLSRLEASQLAPVGSSGSVSSVAAARARGVSRVAAHVRRPADGREACLVAREQGPEWSVRGGCFAEATYVEGGWGMV